MSFSWFPPSFLHITFSTLVTLIPASLFNPLLPFLVSLHISSLYIFSSLFLRRLRFSCNEAQKQKLKANMDAGINIMKPDGLSSSCFLRLLLQLLPPWVETLNSSGKRHQRLSGKRWISCSVAVDTIKLHSITVSGFIHYCSTLLDLLWAMALLIYQRISIYQPAYRCRTARWFSASVDRNDDKKYNKIKTDSLAVESCDIWEMCDCNITFSSPANFSLCVLTF